ncbi:MAG TPA: pitrilysin family protein [Cryomorphaceae bacterium]|nr:pitrilysin family protein [Cryomorphaceae bacterium]
MIEFEKFVLDNGLTLIVHKDKNTPIVSVNTLYKVGARDESPDKTGFAHLFEHLMFSGSKNIADFDGPLQRAGGQNNAFTNNDFTNYYVTLPKENLDTALWLESDRMLDLGFSPEGLEVQRKVVIEEFTQRYLNQPYGDLWLSLRPMAYKVHPYQWATIGKSIAHIEEATMEDVKRFYSRYYSPSNAILTIAGDLDPDIILDRVNRWYGDIPSGNGSASNYPGEVIDSKNECEILKRDVPQRALHMAWLMSDRKDEDYYKFDLLSDVLGNGKSSRLYYKLVTEREIFTQVSAFITGSIDQGLFVVSGMLSEGVEHQEAREAILLELKNLADEPPTQRELTKVKNKVLAQKALSETGALSKAMNLSYYEMLGDVSAINHFQEGYQKVSAEDVQLMAKQLRKRGIKELRYERQNG